jgi:hypothetical protein
MNLPEMSLYILLVRHILFLFLSFSIYITCNRLKNSLLLTQHPISTPLTVRSLKRHTEFLKRQVCLREFVNLAQATVAQEHNSMTSAVAQLARASIR